MNQNDIEEEVNHAKNKPKADTDPKPAGIAQPKNHDFHVQFTLRAVNGVSYRSGGDGSNLAGGEP